MAAGSAVAPVPVSPAARLWPALRQVPGLVRAGSTPAKLCMVLGGLLAVSLLWGAVAAWTVAGHASAAGNVVAVSEPLSFDAQQIYRSLSDADATEPAATRAAGGVPGSFMAKIRARGYLVAGVDQNTYHFGYLNPSMGRSRVSTLTCCTP